MTLRCLCLRADTMKSESRIFYAEQDGNYYLRLVGDVRVTLCGTLNSYIERLFCCDQIRSVVVDLRQSQAVDSTTLGLLAKLALYAQKKFAIKPLLILDNVTLKRLVESMGLDEIFVVGKVFPDQIKELRELHFTSVNTDEARAQVIAAHRTLMELNSKNMLVFSDLIKCLEAERK